MAGDTIAVVGEAEHAVAVIGLAVDAVRCGGIAEVEPADTALTSAVVVADHPAEVTGAAEYAGPEIRVTPDAETMVSLRRGVVESGQAGLALLRSATEKAGAAA